MINIFVIWKSNHFISIAKKILREQNINVSGICTNPDNAIEYFSKCNPKPDILLLDANWGHAAFSAEIILQRFLSTELVKIIITKTFFDQYSINKFKPMGVKGFFYRNQPIDEITTCIKNVYNDKFSFPSK
jgi:DNA-binding NarL/FixJ family response regulator